MNVKIEPSWNRVLAAEWEAPYFKQLTEFVRQEYRTRQVFPPGRQIFAAFDAAPFEQVKVVILGQDPYHGLGQANGLCFSVNEGVPMPPSLINIFKEVHDDVGAPMPGAGASTLVAPRQGLGGVHRPCDSPSSPRTRAPGVHAVGFICQAQGGLY